MGRGTIAGVGVAAVVVAFLLGGVLVLQIKGTPEAQAMRDIERCAEVARIMMTPENFDSQFLSKSRADVVHGPWEGFAAPSRKRGENMFGDQLAQSYKDALYGWTLTCLIGRR